MTNEKSKQCKSKGCYSPVLDGNYCVLCKQKRKEKRDKILAGAGGTVILGCGVAIKKGPKIAAKVIQAILRK